VILEPPIGQTGLLQRNELQTQSWEKDLVGAFEKLVCCPPPTTMDVGG